MQESSFCGEDGQLYSQKIADFVDGELVGLYDMLVALAHHRVKIKADTEAEKDAKEFDLERNSAAINLISGIELQLRELKRIILLT
jgi:hypothetical protein